MAKVIEWIKTNLFKSKKNLIMSVGALALTTILTTISGIEFGTFSNYKAYFWGKDEGNENVTDVLKFSEFSPSLKGTAGDADIYVLEGEQEGPSLLILGGTHPNEPSGQLTATIWLENIHVVKGTVYIITETNRSAFTHSYPQDGSPFYYTVTNDNGSVRTFKFGSRATNTNEQWPNPDIYVHQSGQRLSTSETRNINRAYPGLIDGSYTERVAYAITELIRQKDICMTIDLHEASPEYITIDAVVAHQRAGLIAQDAINGAGVYPGMYDTLCESGNGIRQEVSPTAMHGLTHRELGDHTNTLALLAETSNAAQGKYRGTFTTDLILYENSNDKFYEAAAKLDDGNLGTVDGVLYSRPKSINERVGRHSETIYGMIQSYNKNYANKDLYNASLDTALTSDAIKAAKENPTSCYACDITYDELVAKRISQGQFIIEYNNENELFNPVDYYSMYDSIMDQGIGAFLHDAPSK